MNIKRRHTFLSVSLCLAMYGAPPAFAADIEIKSQPLSTAITELSKKYNQVIVGPENAKTPILLKATTGKTNLVEALNEALTNSDYAAVTADSGAIIIVKKSQQPLATSNENAFNSSIEEVVVVGTYLKGSSIASTLPVSVVNSEDIVAYGITDGGDLLRMMPQSGDVTFNETNFTGGVNTLRGDISSVNLRSIGAGNTLMLINGRRMVIHPSWQNSDSVPVVSYNMNTIPAAGVAQMQAMRDGASALYGADAVAGVLNVVMIDDYEGTSTSLRYGIDTETGKKDINLTFATGTDFANGRGHFALYGGYDYRNAVPTSKYKYAASANRMQFLQGTEFEGSTAFDNRTSIGGHGYFDMINSGSISLADGTVITNSAGRFHVQPTSNTGCLINVSKNICVDDGYWSYATDNEMYHDLGAQRQLYSERNRFNLFSIFNYDLGEYSELYGELGIYYAETNRTGDSPRILTNQRFTISKNAYWNPFGATKLADGTTNPNRLAGVDIPAEGIDLLAYHYRVVDADIRQIQVANSTYRALLGAKGEFGSWDYDTALLYSLATSDDLTENAISVNKLQNSINKTTPDAYNPFCGASCNSKETLASIYDDLHKDATTELALIDFKVANPSIYSWQAGDIGLASGVEIRYESFDEDKDDRLDGTSPFVDSISGKTDQSDSLGDSATNSVKGDRYVYSAFAELSVPLVSEQMDISFVQALDLQIAGRYENFSDVDENFSPRLAASWQVDDNIMFRASWSEGFRVPNLVQSNLQGVSRQSSTLDYARCTAMLKKGMITDISNCGGDQVEIVREAAGTLNSETSENISYGVVFTPEFVEGLTVTLDYWRIEQEGVVGVISGDSQSALDLYYRQKGSSNSNVIREALTDEDKALFAGTGIEPAGVMRTISDAYLNLDKRVSNGIDYALEYVTDTSLGKFTYSLSAARLIRRETQKGEISDILTNLGFDIASVGNQVGLNGSPEWKANSSLKWKKERWSASLTVEYTGGFEETSASIPTDEGEKKYWKIDAWNRVNTFVGYDLTDENGEGLRISLGIRNLFNNLPPMADERFGIFGEIHSPEGRYLYTKFAYSF